MGFSDKIDIILMAYILYCFSIICTIVSEYALYKMNISKLWSTPHFELPKPEINDPISNGFDIVL